MRTISRVAIPACVSGALAVAGCGSQPAFPPEQSREWARPLRIVEFARTEQRIERGHYLTSAVLWCSQCHGELDRSRPGEPPVPGREFAGRVIWQNGTYRVVAPNLTPDKETGAGRWSDDMFLRAIREGVGHDGRALHRRMPYPSFRALSDEDAVSIVAFLRTLVPVRNPLPKTHLSEESKREIESELRPLTEPVAMPDTADSVARGRYFIQLADCVGCHTSWYTDFNPGMLGGGNPVSSRMGGSRRVFSSNITSHQSGIGGLDSTGFISLMRSGRGGSMDPAMPWASFAKMSDRDLEALRRALCSVAPVAHWISNAPPSHCAVCGQEHGMGERNRREHPRGIALSPQELDARAGVYVFEPEGWTITVSREGRQLYATGGDDDPIELVPVEGERCLAPGWVAPVTFEHDENDRVVALVSEEIPPIRFTRKPVK